LLSICVHCFSIKCRIVYYQEAVISPHNYCTGLPPIVVMFVCYLGPSTCASACTCTYTYTYSLCMQHWICSTVELIAHSVHNDLAWLSWWVSGFKSYTTSSLISHTLQFTWRASRPTQHVNVQPQPPRTPILKSVALQTDPATSIPTALTPSSPVAPLALPRPLLKHDAKPPTPSYTRKTPVTSVLVTYNSMSGPTIRRPACKRD